MMRFWPILCAVGVLVLAGERHLCASAGEDDGTLLWIGFDTVGAEESPATGFAEKVLLSGARAAEGIRGTGLSFDGEDDAALVVDPGRDAPQTAFTAEVWVLLRRKVTGRAVVVGKRAPGGKGWAFLLGVEDGVPFATVRLVGAEESAEVELRGDDKLELDWFYHLAVSYHAWRGRAILCVDGKAVDKVWVDGARTLAGEPGQVWIGWGPAAYKERRTVGLPGTVDEVRLSGIDRYPLPRNSIEGWKLDSEQWEAERVRALLELDRLTVRAQDLVRQGYLDAPRYVAWRMRDRERWLERRERSNLELATAQCEAVLSELEQSGEATGISAHPVVETPKRLAPSVERRGERGVYGFVAERVSNRRVDVSARASEGMPPTILVSAHERCRFVPVTGWKREGEQKVRFAATVAVPSRRGDWKLCILEDPGVIGLWVAGRQMSRTRPERARTGAALSAFDLAGELEADRQHLTVELVEEGAVRGEDLRVFLGDTQSISYRRCEGGTGRGLIAGERFTVLGMDDEGHFDSAFIDFFGEAPARSRAAIGTEGARRIGLAVSGKGAILPCEFWDMVAAVRSCGGRLLSLSLEAFLEEGQGRVLGLSVVDGVKWADAAGLRLCIRVMPSDVEGLLHRLGSDVTGDVVQRALLVEVAGGKETGVESGGRALIEAGVPEGNVLEPGADVRFTDGKGIVWQVGRTPGGQRPEGDAVPAFLGARGWLERLGRRSREHYLWNWRPELPSGRNGGVGILHPEGLLLEAQLLRSSLKIEMMTVAVQGYDGWFMRDEETGVGRRYVERAALLAGALGEGWDVAGTLATDSTRTLAVVGGLYGLVAGEGRLDGRDGRLEHWDAEEGRSEPPYTMAAFRVDRAGTRAVVVAAHRGGVRLPLRLPDVQHVYGVNMFGHRVVDLPFFNLSGAGVAMEVLGDPSILYYEVQ